MTGQGWVGRRVLVTGADGFVGRHLCERLGSLGADVIGLTRATCDLSDRRSVTTVVRHAGPDVVLHLAAARQASGAEQRHETATVNAMAGSWVLEAAADTCRTAIRLGSSTEYAASAVPMTEDAPLAPRGYFGATKAAGSHLFVATATELSIRSCVLRAFQVYGPGDKPGRFVSRVMSAARTGRSLPLTVGGRRRDWVWVGDVVEACLLAALDESLAPGAVFNIGTGVQTSNEELVATAERVTGRRIPTLVGADPGRSWDTSDWVSDPTAARVALHWKPEVDLADGLARCWAAA